ncbi:hypothetical protein [Desulfolutivibrio sulfoxidireducens]|uniref:hypothetical protein n=1 Tax=Desulfolutivibrio sulfoxidireducens TaxID=2773299 RepID=UPI00159E6026|nr:hypothetical protein [Desulfolutivibrio sulfoxidireducens]QLA17692.1 hypothetical protein GD605_17215 [Desulfolutivibrio sulfoxidireducens]QLA21268.1 hypothetical protein GD604_16830 [Desulfolutivibrio sulfoxidireducens]
MTEKIYAGDVGTAVVLECGRDLAGVANPAIRVRRPDGTARIWPATVDGTRLVYVTREGDLSMPGIHRLQASFSLGDWTGRGTTAELLVHRAFA